MDDFGKWLKKEATKEKAKECKQRNGECYDCSFKEDCEHEELLNGLDEW